MAAVTAAPALSLRRAVTVSLVVACGCAALLLRPLLSRHLDDPTVVIAVLFSVMLAVGVAWPLPVASGRVRTSTRWTVGALVAGLGAFASGRLLGGLPGVAAVSWRFVLLSSLAAVAEEAFFRRFLYHHLDQEGGALFSVLGTTLLFTVVHVTVYGVWALPIDAAAGLVLGWQRWATGSWRVPAVTHVVANLLMVF
jgi:membrane protease YdiL (CAAX protease family)